MGTTVTTVVTTAATTVTTVVTTAATTVTTVEIMELAAETMELAAETMVLAAETMELAVETMVLAAETMVLATTSAKVQHQQSQTSAFLILIGGPNYRLKLNQLNAINTFQILLTLATLTIKIIHGCYYSA